MEGCVTVDITTDELLEAIQAALGNTDTENAHTVQDLCDRFGCGPTAVRQKLNTIAKQGRLEVVRMRRPSLDGRTSSVPAYRIKP